MFALKPKLSSLNLVVKLQNISCKNGLCKYGLKVGIRKFSEKKYSDIKKILENRSRFVDQVKDDILLFSYPGKELKHTMIFVGSITTMLACINSAHVIYLSWNTQKRTDDGRQSWWKKISGSTVPKYAIITSLIICGVIIAFLGHFYVGRIVKSITLLKGGDSIQLEIYKPFGQSKIRTVDLNNVSSSWTSVSKNSDYYMKVRGDRIGFMLDMRDGKIHDKDTFYKTVGVTRLF